MTEIHLSPRETQVLQGIVDGKTIDVIARELGIAYNTMRYYREKAIRKLGAQSVAEAVAIAVALGIVTVNMARVYIFLECQHALDSSI